MLSTVCLLLSSKFFDFFFASSSSISCPIIPCRQHEAWQGLRKIDWLLLCFTVFLSSSSPIYPAILQSSTHTVPLWLNSSLWLCRERDDAFKIWMQKKSLFCCCPFSLFVFFLYSRHLLTKWIVILFFWLSLVILCWSHQHWLLEMAMLLSIKSLKKSYSNSAALRIWNSYSMLLRRNWKYRRYELSLIHTLIVEHNGKPLTKRRRNKRGESLMSHMWNRASVELDPRLKSLSFSSVA